MRIAAIITEGLANRYLSVELARANKLVAIFQPRFAAPSLTRKLQSFRALRAKYGTLHVALNKLGQGIVPGIWPGLARMAAAETAFFATVDKEYAATVAPLVDKVDAVNSPAFIDRLRTLGVDAVVCSCGPIYRAPLIRAAGLMLNYHTGISPLYNGTNTIWWAYANGHPHLCGAGTPVVHVSHSCRIRHSYRKQGKQLRTRTWGWRRYPGALFPCR